MKERKDQIIAEIQPGCLEVDLGNYRPVSEHKESECEALNDKQIAKPVLYSKVHSERGVMLLMCLHFEQTTVSF